MAKETKWPKGYITAFAPWCLGSCRALGIPALHLHKGPDLSVALSCKRGGNNWGEGADRRQERAPPRGTEPSSPASLRPSRPGERVWPRHREGVREGRSSSSFAPDHPFLIFQKEGESREKRV